MRRILFPILTIGVVAGMFSIGSGAFFSDTETSTGNTFTAGELDLSLSGGSQSEGSDSVTGTIVVGPLKPGDSGSGSLTLTNSGDIDGFVDLSSVAVANTEGTNPESESGDTGEPGELGGKIDVTVCWDLTDGDGDCDDELGTSIIFSGTLDGFAAATPFDEDEALDVGSPKVISIEWVWTDSGDDTDNEAQGDVATLSFTVELDQTAD